MKHDEITKGLANPFRKEEEHTRQQSGKTFTYAQIQSYEQRLDEVVGIENWQCRYEFGTNGEIICYLGVRFGDDWVWKADGAGQTQFEAEKGGLTDAFKRACKRFGLGRYFYWGEHLPQRTPVKKEWTKKQRDIIQNHAPSVNPGQIDRFLDMSELPENATVGDVKKFALLYQGNYDEHGKKGDALQFAKENS